LGPVITLTTDFGYSDGYQGVLEGVIAGINPAARVVPISHEVPPGDIIAGWYLLKTHYLYYPPGSVHLAVVDPGVGGRRKIVAVRTARYLFVAPDNGLLSFLPNSEIISVHSITNRKYALSSISPVFHGRDIMAPAAAYLSLDVDPSCLGRSCRKIKSLTVPRPTRRGRKIFGHVIYVDRFGNLITDIPQGWLSRKARVAIAGEVIGQVRRTFSDVREGRPVAYLGSGGHLEIAIRGGSANDRYCPGNYREVEIEVALG